MITNRSNSLILNHLYLVVTAQLTQIPTMLLGGLELKSVPINLAIVLVVDYLLKELNMR